MTQDKRQLTDNYNTPQTGPLHHEALYRISLAINAELDLPVILNEIVRYCRLLVRCEDSSVILWDEQTKQFQEGASTTKVGKWVASRVRLDGGSTRWIIENGQPVIVADIEDDSFGPNPMLIEDSIAAYAGVPIRQKGKTFGVLYALSQQIRQFNEADILKLRELATMAAIAIQNTQLINSLRELNQLKDNMMQIASHNLRSPLGLARGYLSVLVEDLSNLNDDQLQWIAIIERSLERIDELSASILEYERLSAMSEMRQQSCDLNMIASQVVSDFKVEAKQKNQDIRLETSPKSLIVNGDESLLRQALGNLVSNAIKYTPENGWIAIRTAVSDNECLVSVEDNGLGIAQDEQEKLFDPFVRLKSAKGSQGSGLGLNLAQIIVERQDGRVTVESDLGKGSIFTIFLPLN